MDIREDIKHYQDTLSYTSSKVDYSEGQGIYMLSSDMNLKIKTGTVGYNNKILVSDEKFSLRKNDEVNEAPKISHEPTHTHGVPRDPGPLRAHELAKKPNITHVLTQAQKPTITHDLTKKPTHEDEKIALLLALVGGFAIWNIFR